MAWLYRVRGKKHGIPITYDAWQAAAKVIQSTHPEGSREWAEDAMRAGFEVANDAEAESECVPYRLRGKAFVDKDNLEWTWAQHPIEPTGWRIHQSAIAQLAASIEAHEKRILALEGKG